MSDAELTPQDLAAQAMEAATSAMETLKRFLVGYDADAAHAAWRVLHESERSAGSASSDEETWIRQAAMMLLVGLEAGSRDDTIDDDGGAQAAALEDQTNEQIDEAWRLLARGDLDQAESLLKALLEQAARQDAENVGDVVHHGHIILGHVSLRHGDDRAAEDHLLAAANVASSPVLGSFGPNMSLARELLRRNRPEAVLAYFDRCASFWGPLARWRADVGAGIMPDFGPNLIYGVPKDVHDQIRAST